jgi:hypothetical protein
MSIFVVSVLPAPLSPLTKMDWLPWSFIIALMFQVMILGVYICIYISYKICYIQPMHVNQLTWIGATKLNLFFFALSVYL